MRLHEEPVQFPALRGHVTSVCSQPSCNVVVFGQGIKISLVCGLCGLSAFRYMVSEVSRIHTSRKLNDLWQKLPNL